MSHLPTGITVGDVVQLDANGKLPVIGGGSLTGLLAYEYLLYLSSDQAYGSIALGGVVLLANVIPAGGVVSAAAGTVTLPANSKCFLYFCAGIIGASVDADWSAWQWYDTTGGGATPIGVIGTGMASRTTTSQMPAAAAIAYVATAGSTATVQVRRVIAGGVNSGMESTATVAYIRVYK